MEDAPSQAVARKRLSYRGTRIGEQELAWLQAAADSWRSPSIQDVAAEACRHFGWIRPNGELATKASILFLRRLQRWGALRLPPGRQLTGRRHPDDDRWQMLEWLGPIPGMVECQPEGPLCVRPIAEEERAGFRLHMDRYHYLGFVRPAGESICYAAFLGQELVALLVWGGAIPCNEPRDRHIGWDRSTRLKRLPFVVNNSRFLVLPWVKVSCLASRVLSANLRRLSRDWQTTYRHPLLLAETFVDATRFQGTCYRASNWTYVGQTRGFSRAKGTKEGFARNGRPKAVFVFTLHRRAIEQLRQPALAAAQEESAPWAE
jgi:hypothetical protein